MEAVTLIPACAVERWDRKKRQYQWVPGFSMLSLEGKPLYPPATLKEWRFRAAQQGMKLTICQDV